MDVVISVLEPGGMADLESLDDWLRGDHALGGQVAQRRLPPEPGQLGGLTDALVVSVGAGRALTELVSMLRAWVLRPRHCHLRLRVRTGQDTMELDADRARAEDVETLVAALRAGEQRQR
jgi:Effector Associated Constant Component 1